MYVLMRTGVAMPLYVDPELSRIASLAVIESNKAGSYDGLELYEYNRASNTPTRIDPIPTLGTRVSRLGWVNLRLHVSVEGDLGTFPRPSEVKKAAEFLLKHGIMPHGDYKNFEVLETRIVKDEPPSSGETVST